MNQNSQTKARFIKPPNLIKQKVGSGGLDDSVLEKAQKTIETNTVDFIPYAREFLAEVTQAIATAKDFAGDSREMLDQLIEPFMKLKANGGMFQYQLVSNVADIALQFLENIAELNEDSIDVLQAHEKTLRIIITSQLKGTGGPEGAALVTELRRATDRYFSKHAAPENKG